MSYYDRSSTEHIKRHRKCAVFYTAAELKFRQKHDSGDANKQIESSLRIYRKNYEISDLYEFILQFPRLPKQGRLR